MLLINQSSLFKPPYKWDWSTALLAPKFASIAEGLGFLFPMWEDGGSEVYDLVSGRSLTIEANASWASGVGGVGSTTSSTTAGHFNNAAWQPITTSDGVGTGDFTVLSVADPVSESRVAALCSQRVGSGLFNQLVLAANCSSAVPTATAGSILFATYSGTIREVTTTLRVDGNVHCWAGRRSAATMQIWEDGSQIVTASPGAAQDVTIAGQAFRIGNFAAQSGDYALKQRSYLCAGWNRALSDEEMNFVTALPWGLITPAAMFYGSVISAGGAVIGDGLINGRLLRQGTRLAA